MSSSLPIPFRAAIPCCMLHERLVRWGSPPRPPTGAACGLCASPGRCEWLQRATWTCCRCGGHGAGKGASGGAGRVQMWCGGLLRARGGGETQLFLRTQRCSQWHPPPSSPLPPFCLSTPPSPAQREGFGGNLQWGYFAGGVGGCGPSPCGAPGQSGVVHRRKAPQVWMLSCLTHTHYHHPPTGPPRSVRVLRVGWGVF